jgi:hypothetical protein
MVFFFFCSKRAFCLFPEVKEKKEKLLTSKKTKTNEGPSKNRLRFISSKINFLKCIVIVASQNNPWLLFFTKHFEVLNPRCDCYRIGKRMSFCPICFTCCSTFYPEFEFLRSQFVYQARSNKCTL